MKRLLLILTLASSTALAAEPASPAPRPVQDFSNLTQDKRNEFAQIYQEASRLFQQKRIFETLEKLDAAERIFPDSAALLNLRGVALIEFRSFDKATAAFTRALEINPEMPGVKFNLAEIAFVTHEWKAAAERFEALIPQLSKDDTGLLRLIEYKILLSKLKLGQVEDARKLAAKYDFLDDSPFYYYAKASLAYHDGKPEDAQQWLGRATRIFRTAALLSPWQDTLMEYNRKPGADDAPVLGIPVPEAVPATEE